MSFLETWKKTATLIRRTKMFLVSSIVGKDIRFYFISGLSCQSAPGISSWSSVAVSVLSFAILLHGVSPCLFVVIALSARGVMVIVVGNGHGDTTSNPGRD